MESKAPDPTRCPTEGPAAAGIPSVGALIPAASLGSEGWHDHRTCRAIQPRGLQKDGNVLPQGQSITDYPALEN